MQRDNLRRRLRQEVGTVLEIPTLVPLQLASNLEKYPLLEPRKKTLSCLMGRKSKIKNKLKGEKFQLPEKLEDQ